MLHHPDTHEIRRVLLSSANLSLAAWGYRRSATHPDDDKKCSADGLLEVRSFEMGVCVPVDPEEARAALPFQFHDRDGGLGGVDPYVGIQNYAGEGWNQGSLYY